jgi:hypothetical protein
LQEVQHVADEPKKMNLEQWSASIPGDLGLRAAYWTKKPEDPLTFRPIVAWVVYNVRPADAPAQAPINNGFTPVVVSPWFWPVLANQLVDYLAVFPSAMDETAVIAEFKAWEEARANNVQVNVPGRGQA